MVHSLRDRKICTSSPDSELSLIIANSDDSIMLQSINMSVLSSAATETPAGNDMGNIWETIVPSITIPPQDSVNNCEMQGTGILSSTTRQPAAGNVSDIEMLGTPILSSTTRPPKAGKSKTGKSKKHSKVANQSTFIQTLAVCVDTIIFESTYKRTGGVSFYMIRKQLSEKFCYNINRNRKQIRNYIADSLVSGKLKQISGRGARGSVRLSKNEQRKFARAHNEHESVSIRERLRKAEHSLSGSKIAWKSLLKRRISRVKKQSTVVDAAQASAPPLPQTLMHSIASSQGY